jgi:hypothetical protein
MIIPNKSTMVEEFIDIPYGRDHRERGTTIDEQERSVEPIRIRDTNADNDLDNASDYPSPMSPRSPLAGLSGLSARLKGVDDDDDDMVAGNRSGEYLYDKYGRSSFNSDRSLNGAIGAWMMARASVTYDQERMRRE